MNPCRDKLYKHTGIDSHVLWVHYIDYVFISVLLDQKGLLRSMFHAIKHTKDMMILFHYSKKFQEIKEKNDPDKRDKNAKTDS